MKLKTADAHLRLGEVCLETEDYETAIKDFESCLKIQQEFLEPESRLIAETYPSELKRSSVLCLSLPQSMLALFVLGNICRWILDSRHQTLPDWPGLHIRPQIHRSSGKLQTGCENNRVQNRYVPSKEQCCDYQPR